MKSNEEKMDNVPTEHNPNACECDVCIPEETQDDTCCCTCNSECSCESEHTPTLTDPMSIDDPDIAKMKKEVWDLIFLMCPEFSNMLIDIFRNGGGSSAINTVYNDIIRYATIAAIVNHEIPVGVEASDK